MDAHLEAKLIECLDALAQGESVERILARYPQEAGQLRPLLETAAFLPTLRREPSEAAKLQSRQKFLAQADLLRRTTPRKTLGFLPRLAAGFIAVALVAVVLSTGAVAASGSALPGDPLYGLKRAVENAQLSFSSSAARESLIDQLAQRRRDEINQLLSAGRPGEVEFTGTIESLQPEAWIVSGLVVQLDEKTQIVGTPQLDRVAAVRGLTGPNGLRAISISIEPAGAPDVTTPQATETPKPAATAEPTKTKQPSLTITPTLQPTSTPRPTATAEPTGTPQPVEVEFIGTVSTINADTWIIDGMTVAVNASTEIRGAIAPGQRVKVKALRYADGRLVATRIEPAGDDGGNNNANGNGNQNSNENQNGNDSNSNDNDDDDNHNSNGNGGGSNDNDNKDDHSK
jgi:hypothetical protein